MIGVYYSYLTHLPFTGHVLFVIKLSQAVKPAKSHAGAGAETPEGGVKFSTILPTMSCSTLRAFWHGSERSLNIAGGYGQVSLCGTGDPAVTQSRSTTQEFWYQ